MDFLTLPGLSGWPSTVFTLIILVIGLIYINKSAKNKAKTVAEEAQKAAIEAMQAEIAVLRRQMEDERKENIQLRHTIDTLITALEKQGLYITISGNVINIEVQDHPKKVTTVRIQDTKVETA